MESWSGVAKRATVYKGHVANVMLTGACFSERQFPKSDTTHLRHETGTALSFECAQKSFCDWLRQRRSYIIVKRLTSSA